MGRLLDEDDVIDAINKRISVLQKHPEFRRKHADIDLYGIKSMIAELSPAFQLRTDEIAQFTGEIIEIFEDFLERKQIVIANDEKDDAITDGEDPACIGNIYGTDYGELQSDIEETLLRWRLVKEEK